jgi:hypothetical protein
VGSSICFRKLMPDAECLCGPRFDVSSLEWPIRLRNAATRIEPTMKRNKASKEINLKDLFHSGSFPRLSLIPELANGRLTLPRTQEWWGFENDGDVVWNKKPIEVTGRGGRYIRYRLLLGSFVIYRRPTEDLS